MSSARHIFAWLLLIVLVALIGWRILATGLSDRLAAEHPEQALQWDSNNAAALLALAQQQLARHQPGDARQTARRLLQVDPLAGHGFVVLSNAAEAEGNESLAMMLRSIAVRRAPHDVGPRAWLAGEQLKDGRYAEALDGIDRILRIAPAQYEGLFPVLINLARRPDFAEALSAKLAEHPAWRSSFVETLLGSAGQEEMDQVFSALQHRGDLDSSELNRWIDRLAAVGKWGEAYARWASELPLGKTSQLSRVYNGGFESEPSGHGFDWRIGNSAGVIVERAAVADAKGSYAARLTFLGRRVDVIPLDQWLVLAPGSYRLHLRARARDLRSDRGLQWTIRCLDTDTELAASERMNGTFDWQEKEMDFVVPDSGCQAQDLGLHNSAADGPARIVLGTIWFDDIAID
jgi:tetratricopeptide (TPR) repeat protein